MLTIYYLLFTIICLPVFALEFDTSIDEEIRKNYNPTKIEQDMSLPTLPKILDKNEFQNNIQPIKTNQSESFSKQYKNYSSVKQSYIKLKKGTHFKLKVLNTISDRSTKGTKVTFKSIYPVTTTFYTIPAGTIFQGYILNSHRPQLSGNGGLIVININSIILNEEVQPINTIVTKAASKMIFFGNIKGKRKYISSIFRTMRPGCHYFKKMLTVSGELARDGSSIFVAPFSFALGVFAAGGNILISPALALFYKGSSICIHEGSVIEIKLSQDVFIYS